MHLERYPRLKNFVVIHLEGNPRLKEVLLMKEICGNFGSACGTGAGVSRELVGCV